MIGSLRQACCCVFLCLIWINRIDSFTNYTCGKGHTIFVSSFALEGFNLVGVTTILPLWAIFFVVRSYLCTITLSSSK
jgi:hypothetical protein